MTLDKIFDQCCKDRSGSFCPCSSWGLQLIKSNASATEVFEREIGSLPQKAVPGCKRYVPTNVERGGGQPALSGLKQHAQAKMGAARTPAAEEDEDEDEDEEAIRLLHECLFQYLDKRLDPRAKMSQLQSNMAGERAQNKADKRKLEEEKEQERKRRHGAEQQLRQEREQLEELKKEHQRVLDELDQKHKQFMDDSNCRLKAMRAQCTKEFESLIDEKLETEKQARQLEAEKRQALEQKRQALEQAEAEKRQLRMELELEKVLQKQRNEALLNEVQETLYQEMKQERADQMRALEDMLKKKEKECESLEDDYAIQQDSTDAFNNTINALQTKVDALYCVAYATVPEAHQSSLQPLSMGGIDVKQRDGAKQIVDYTCGHLADMSSSHACKAATALGMAGRNDLKHKELLQKIREALSGTGPARSR